MCVCADNVGVLGFALDDVDLSDQVERFLCFRVFALFEDLAPGVRVIPSSR